ncbi:hypothetical protein CLU79DRAFT_833264 [Phycomyces nitens]|nr:hypothetical protein CLU79DRAFT_833264 [Phycomyces nitens]
MNFPPLYATYGTVTENTTPNNSGQNFPFMTGTQFPIDCLDRMPLFLHSTQFLLSQVTGVKSGFSNTVFTAENFAEDDIPAASKSSAFDPIIETDDPGTGMYIDDRFFTNQTKERLCCTDHVSEFLENDNMIIRSGNDSSILPFRDTCFYPDSQKEYEDDTKWGIIPLHYTESIHSLSSCSEEHSFFDEDILDQPSLSSSPNLPEIFDHNNPATSLAYDQSIAKTEPNAKVDCIINPESSLKIKDKASISYPTDCLPQESCTVGTKLKNLNSLFKKPKLPHKPTIEDNHTSTVKNNTPETRPRVKRTATSYDSETTKYLKSTFYNIYSKNNKLSKSQRRTVQENTGLSPRSITYWFSNHKRRHPKDIQLFKQTIAKSKEKIKTYEDFLQVQMQKNKKPAYMCDQIKERSC